MATIKFEDRDFLSIQDNHESQGYRLSLLVYFEDRESGKVLDAFLLPPGKFLIQVKKDYTNKILRKSRIKYRYNDITAALDLKQINVEMLSNATARRLELGILLALDEFLLNGQLGDYLGGLSSDDPTQFLIGLGGGIAAWILDEDSDDGRRFARGLWEIKDQLSKAATDKNYPPHLQKRLDLVDSLARNPNYVKGLTVDFIDIDYGGKNLNKTHSLMSRVGIGGAKYTNSGAQQIDMSWNKSTTRLAIQLSKAVLTDHRAFRLASRKYKNNKPPVSFWGRFYLTASYQYSQSSYSRPLYVNEKFLDQPNDQPSFLVQDWMKLSLSEFSVGVKYFLTLDPNRMPRLNAEPYTFMIPFSASIGAGLSRAQGRLIFVDPLIGTDVQLSGTEFDVVESDAFAPYFEIELGRQWSQIGVFLSFRTTRSNLSVKDNFKLFSNDSQRDLELPKTILNTNISFQLSL